MRYLTKGEASCGPMHLVAASDKHSQQCVDTNKEVHLRLNELFKVLGNNLRVQTPFPSVSTVCPLQPIR